MIDTVAGLHQAKTSLFVQRGVVAEPDHHGTRIGIKIEFIITMEQCFKRGRSHNGFTRPCNGSEGKCSFVGFALPETTGLS